jgi:hypothetical protein
MKLRIIKSKAFKANNEDHTHYTVAYKGRVFGVSTLRFDEGNFTVEGTTLTLNVDVEVVQENSVDQLTGETASYLTIVPKMDILLAKF